MEIYTPNDQILFDENHDKIIKKANVMSQKVLGPSLEEIKKIQKIIFEYIKNNKRIIYGGFALNLYLIKFKKDANLLYETQFENNYPHTTHNVSDIDCYSPDPHKDMIAICDLLHNAKIKNVEGKEAQHTETYIVYAQFTEFCNFTYMPSIIINIIPKIHFKVNNYDVIMLRTDIVSIDYFRIFTDPIGSYRLLEKQFNRYIRLQSIKGYKLGGYEKKQLLNNIIINDIPHDVINTIYNFIKNNNEIILFGYFLYNVFSIISESNDIIKKYPVQFISIDYKNCVILVYSILKKKFGDKITIKEYYPFFQYLDHNVAFYYDNICIVQIYNNNERCTPFKKINMMNNVISNIQIQKDDSVYIGTFSVNIMMILILYTYAKIYNNKKAFIYDNMLTDLLKFRSKYLSTIKKTIFDDNIFEEFVVNCIGYTIRPDIKKWNLGKKRLQMNKKPVFKYIPTSNAKNEMKSFSFANCSGNKIKNENKYTFKEIPHYISNQ